MTLVGKGLWAYRLWELDRALDVAPQMGITHLLYKVGQGPWRGKRGYYISGAADIAERIRDAGYTPLAWSFTTLADAEFAAEMVLQTFHDGYEGFIFNAEDATNGRRAAAIAVGARLMVAGVDPQALYLCSYPTPITHHPQIPYDEMGAYCKGGLMPMAYGTYHLPPNVVVDAWTYTQNRVWMRRQGYELPIYPVLGPYYDEFGNQRMSLEQYEEWLHHLALHRPSFFSVYTAAVVEPIYFAPTRAFTLGDGEEVEPITAWVCPRGGGVLFSIAGRDGTQLAAYPYATEVQRRPETITVDGQEWVGVSIGGRSGWMRADALASAAPPPWPDLEPVPLPPPGQLHFVWNTTDLNLRSEPIVRPSTLVGRIPEGTRLRILQDLDEAPEWLGEVGRWFRVRVEPDGPEVFVAAWYVTDVNPNPPEDFEPEVRVQVVSPDAGFLNIRKGPSTSTERVDRVDDGAVLSSLEPAESVREKVGEYGSWIKVLTPTNVVGYAAAWYLRLYVEAAPVLHYAIVDSPTWGLRVRSGPGTDYEQVWWVPHETALESLEDPTVTVTKIGQEDEWLHVRTPALKVGYVAAWYLKRPASPDTREPVVPASLPLGETAWIFGMHAASIGDDTTFHRERIRALFEGRDRRGWVLFTEAIGNNPHLRVNEGLRRRLWDWVRAGYGVVVRLNHAYHPGGTLPRSEEYEAFAATCARWVELYLKRPELAPSDYTWIVQIANEQNNPSEHPGDRGVIHEHITAELYARAFNLAYDAVKAVLPAALVAPGAVDPYNTAPLPLLGNQRWRPLNYFDEMLERIEELDAFTLHAYTHGPSVDAITSLETFADPFAGDHYTDFRTYRLFMERIPPRWRDRPVLITETDHICRPPNAPMCDDPAHQGWINANIGWIQAAYAEVDRWNRRPYAQQIRGLLLYRWLGDQWEMYDKPELLNDFIRAMQNDYRWRT